MKRTTRVPAVLAMTIAAAIVCAVPARAATRYLSPAGRDAANGAAEATAWKTFARAFSQMQPGDELVLLDGVYSVAAGTGVMSDKGANSAQVPSGAGRGRETIVRAAHPGRVTVLGRLVVGTRARKDEFIRIEGITFEGGGSLYNTRFVTLRQCGFHAATNSAGSVLGIGTNDHAQGNDDNLVEDCWVWGQERVIAITYRSQRNVWRRVVVRGDGCASAACAGSPNVGITVYDSAYTSLQNVLVIDRVLGGGAPYSDFAVAQHTRGVVYGRNEWLGTLSLRAPDAAYYFEPDEAALAPAHLVRNCVAWDARAGGLNLARAGVNDIANCTIHVNGHVDAVRVAPELRSAGGSLTNLVVLGTGRYAVNSAIAPSFVDASGSWREGVYNQARCTEGCRSTNPTSDGRIPSMKYIVRIEPRSALKGGAAAGADYGANIVARYGIDGTHFGEPGFNALSDAPLWPWRHEDRIQKEMCAEAAFARGFCSATSLTAYIWGYLGTPGPPQIGSPGAAQADPARTPPRLPGGRRAW